ncbi:MAG: hypothetical protein ACLUW6_11385, partial [Coriobacteriaceae bacterium]
MENALFLFCSYAQQVNKKIVAQLGNFFLQVNKNGAILNPSIKPTDQLIGFVDSNYSSSSRARLGRAQERNEPWLKSSALGT